MVIYFHVRIPGKSLFLNMAEQYRGRDHVKSRIERYCILQDRCQEEVRQKLRSLGCTPAETDDWLIHLISEGFIQEERYARSFARGHFRIKRWGRILIRKHLEARKISAENIRLALEGEIEEDDYLETIRYMLDKKARADGLNPELPLHRRKLVHFLVGKGFETDCILKVLSAEAE